MRAKAPSCYLSCKSSTTLKLFKQLTALLQTINCRKAWGKQPTGTEQGSPHCLVWNSHNCLANTAANRGQFAEQRTLPNNSVALCLIMVQRDGEMRSWITSGGHTLIGIDWHSFGVLLQTAIAKITICDLAINWYLWIIYTCIKNNLNNCIQIAWKRCDQAMTNTQDFQWWVELPPCMVTNTSLTCLVGPQT
jgi:hypothetical protein